MPRPLLAITPIAALWMLVGSAHPALSESGVEIVDRAIEYHGGELFAASRTQLSLCSKSGCYRIVARIEEGLYEIEVEGRVRGGQRRVVMDNDELRLWIDSEPQPTPADRIQALRDWAMARVYFAFLPFRLQDPSVNHQDLGLEVWHGRPLHKVKVTFDAGSSTGAEDEFLYWFDPETARLEQFAYSFSENSGGVRFRRAFNFRRIGGLLFFDQENFGVDRQGASVDEISPATVADWQLLSTVTLRDIEVESLP